MKKNILVIIGILVIVLALVFVFSLKDENVSSEQNDKYMNLIDEGNTLKKAKDYESAIIKFLAANEISKGDEQILISLSDLYNSTEEYEEALTYISQAIDINEKMNSSEELRILGDALFGLDRVDEAIEKLLLSIEIDPYNNSSWLSLGNCYKHNKQINKAIEVYNKVVILSNDFQAYNNLIMIYKDTDKRGLYQDTIKETFARYPDNYEINILYGEVLVYEGDFDKILYHYDDMRKRFTENTISYEINLLYGKALESKGDFNMAISHYKQMEKEFESDSSVIRLVPEYYNRVFEYNLSLENLESKSPLEQDDEFIELYINTFKKINTLEDTLKLVDEAINRKNDGYIIYYLKGKLLFDGGFYLESLPYFDKAIKFNEEYEIYEYKMNALYASNRVYRLIDFIDFMIDKFGDTTPIKLRQAVAYYQIGNFEKSLELNLEVLEADVYADIAKFYIAETLYKLGDYEKSLEYLENYKLDRTTYNANVVEYMSRFKQQNVNDTEFLYVLFITDYIYRERYSGYPASNGDISDEEMSDLFYEILDESDRYSYFLYGDECTKFMARKSELNYKQLDEKNHYFDIDYFTSSTVHEFIQDIDTIENSEESHLIIDLRNNTGEEYTSAVMILDALIDDSSVIGYSNNILFKRMYTSPSKTSFKNIYVIVNDKIGSSSELLALGLNKYLDNVSVIGVASDGKGIVLQSVHDPIKNRMYNIAIGHWIIDNKSIQEIGIVPDFLLDNEDIEAYMIELLGITGF